MTFKVGINVSVKRYTKAQVVLHWLSAVVILWALVSGFYISLLEVSAKIKSWVGSFNVSLTTLYVPFFVWRVILYVRRLGSGCFVFSNRMDYIVFAVHFVMYFLIFIVLLSGVLMMTRPISVFGLLNLAPLLSDGAVRDGFLIAHVGTCIALGLMVVVHIAAVVRHECAGRRVLKRMTFQKPTAFQVD